MFLSKEQREERVKHNENLGEVPEVLKEGILPGNHLIVRRKYFVDMTKSKAGILLPAMEVGSTADDRPKPKFSEKHFSPVAKILKIGTGEEAQDYKVGDEVLLDYRLLGRGTYTFPIDLDNAVAAGQGIERIPTNLVIFIRSREKENK